MQPWDWISIRHPGWLGIQERIAYKILIITCHAHNGSGPGYLAELIQPYRPGHEPRSANENKLEHATHQCCLFWGQTLKLWLHMQVQPHGVVFPRLCVMLTLSQFKGLIKTGPMMHDPTYGSCCAFI